MVDQKRLREYVDTLDRTDKMVVTLLYGYELTFAEVADVLNVTPSEALRRQQKIVLGACVFLGKADAGNR